MTPNNNKPAFFLLLMTLLAFGSSMAAGNYSGERLLITTDKTLYVAGETILLQVTTTDADHRPIDFSKVAYAELLGDERPEQQIILSLRNTSGTGHLQLPAYLATGWYKLVAYTRAMRNEGSAVFSSLTIGVVNPEQILLTGKTDENVISGNDAAEINIALQTDKNDYPTRSSGMLTIGALPPNTHLLNIRIAGKSPLQLAPATALIGKIPSGEQTEQEAHTIPEYEGHIITGRLYTADGMEPLPTAGLNIYLSAPGKPWSLVRGNVTPSGELTFITHRMEGSKEVVTVISSPVDARWQIDLDPPFAHHAPTHFQPLLADSTQLEAILHDIAQRTLMLQAASLYGKEKESELISAIPAPHQPTWSYRLDDYTRFDKMEEVILEFVTNVRFRNILGQRKLTVNTAELDGYAQGNTLVLLDEVPVFDHELLLSYNTRLIAKIDVYRGKYVFGGQLFDGIVSFSTYNRDFAGFELDHTTSISNYAEIQSFGQEHRHSVVAPTALPANHPDFRHTLLWMPSVRTAGADELKIEFCTSDLTGSFEVEVTGVTTDGKILRGKSSLTTSEAHRGDHFIVR